MIFVDTGFFIASLLPSDQLHHRAHAWAALARPPFLVTEYVLVEMMNQLTRSRDRPRAIAAADRMLNPHAYEFIHASPPLLASGLELFRRRPDKLWSLTDCISFNIMRERGITQALAYDEHFVQAGFDAVLRRDPN